MATEITAGIICYNEKHIIEACIRSALKFCDKVIVTDGVMNGTRVDKGSRSEICTPSTDGTREIIAKIAAEDNRVVEWHFDGLPTPTEQEIRNVHLFLCDTEWFMIVDADEIWDPDMVPEAISECEATHASSAYVKNRLYFWNPYFYVFTKHQRLFHVGEFPDMQFIGNNEVAPDPNCVVLGDNVWFHHYGYIDPAKVKFKMDLYGSETFYRGVGPWWYENVFMAFDGTLEGAKELVSKNYGTLHPWGKIHPGFAHEEFTPLLDASPSHPGAIRQYFLQRGFDCSNISFSH